MGYLENLSASLDGKRIAFADSATARAVTVSVQAGLEGTATAIDSYLTPAVTADATKIKFGHTFTIPSGAVGRNLARRLTQILIRLDSNQPLVQLGSASVGYWLSGPGERIENVRWEFYDLLTLLGHDEPGMVREIVDGVWTGQMIPGTVRVSAPCAVAIDATGATLTIDVSGLTFAAGQIINLDPIARTGSATLAGYTRTNTGTYTITVPADAEIILVGVTGYFGSAGYLDAMTCTKGSTDTAMTKVAGDGSTSYFMGAMFYLVSPDTGASKSLKWNWAGSDVPDSGVPCVYAFYKGIDTASPVRDSDGAQGADGATTPTLTAQSNDLIVAWGWNYRPAAPEQTPTFTGVTNVGGANEFNLDYSDADTFGCGMWGEGSPSGNQTVQYNPTADNDGGVCAIVLKPAAPTEVTGTGALTSGNATIAGTADLTTTGSGTLASQSAAMAATGLYLIVDADLLQWTWTGSGQTSWKVYWDTDSGAPYANSYAFGDANTRSVAFRDFLTITGLYYAVVVACNGEGEGTASNEVYFASVSGSLLAQAAALAGQGTVATAECIGTGALVTQTALIAGAGTSESTGTGALTAQAVTIAGDGISASYGTGALPSAAAALSGEGTSESTGTGAMEAQAATVSGTGEISSEGAGALVTSAASLSGEGTIAHAGAGSLASQAATISGAGISDSTGTGALSAQVATISGAGESSSTGTGTLPAELAQLNGEGTVAAGGAAAAAITGTATESIAEVDLVTGGRTIIITLTNDTWVAA